uniref:Antitoxin component of toxin-antitoxin stability system, DNA-binding transcriptional repressor n=1 Tax=Candidatus Kentrum sp. FW TaxID=2126338 RepID=A0A450THC7_9GAMM|nr:MAG: Antitoxin component of toxin-antitoxin stability system, DNA-binding transcriptional repressor [Candidatus Kentron sp. FW]VFJ66650.1 MAG: Antitoxin component of toxin-antitoxin stability system, DNA-binding transcriptional repressor [Candidatus Kentron sp. FW]
MKVDLFEARSQFPRLVQAALAGDEIIIADQGHPTVRLVPVQGIGGHRQSGMWSGLPIPEEDWDSPQFNREIAGSLIGGDT